MDCLEIVRLRTRHGDRADLIDRLQESIVADEVATSTGSMYRVRIWSHMAIETDLCLVVVYERPAGPAGRSPVGLRLASALGEFGVVEHSAWSGCSGEERQYRQGLPS